MNKVRLVILSSLIILAGAAAIILPRTDLFKPKPIHIHAGFQVYKDDVLQSFSDSKYMHEAPCTVNGKPVDDPNEDDQIEKAHLHDHNGDVVHVHRNGAVWGDLFQNIHYAIPANAVAYINGKKADNILNQPIKAYDSVVIFVGKHTDDQKYLKKAVTKQRIKQVESGSETCSST